jgi:hypothetical protein
MFSRIGWQPEFLATEKISFMEEKNLSNGFSKNLEILISGLSDDLKNQEERLDHLSEMVKTLSTKVENIAPALAEMLSENSKKLEQTLYKKLSDIGNSNKPVDTTSIEYVLKSGITEIRSLVSQGERPVIKKFPILFFPEQNAERFYKIVYGGIFLVIVIVFFLHHTYKVILHQQEINKEIQIGAQKNNPLTKAWDYLYSRKNKQLHKQMDSALFKTIESTK